MARLLAVGRQLSRGEQGAKKRTSNGGLTGTGACKSFQASPPPLSYLLRRCAVRMGRGVRMIRQRPSEQRSPPSNEPMLVRTKWHS